MWNPRVLIAVVLSSLLLGAQPAPPPRAMEAPVLQPGEGFAITLGDDVVWAYGEARKEAPMGSLAKLVWLKLEGAEWASQGLRYQCKGTQGSWSCWNHEGHGRVDQAKALQVSCNLAYLAWIADSQSRWIREYGEAPARLRMEEVFAPFLGRRLPVGDNLPPLSPAWVGDGDLLRTSAEGFLRWLMEPDRAEVVAFAKRYLAGFWVEVRELLGKEAWWFKTGTGPVPGDPTATCAWVACGRGPILAVLYLPRGRGKHEGMARIREVLKLQ